MVDRLMTYNAAAQHYGTWISGYPWTLYGCGTFRSGALRADNSGAAERSVNIYFKRLEDRMHGPVPHVGTFERRYSGCGLSPIPLHLHFLAASSEPDRLLAKADQIWTKMFGHCQFEPFNPDENGPHYVAKLFAHDNGEPILGGLATLDYRGPADLLEAAGHNPYVPDHLKWKTHGEYLVVR